MENIKKDEWLHEEFGIKVNNRYLCIPKNSKAIRGQILNFSPYNNVVIKAEDGLHILPYSEILSLRPLPIKEEKFKVGMELELKRDYCGDLVFDKTFLGLDVIATTVLPKGKKGTVYYIDSEYIYVDSKEGKFRIKKGLL